MIDLNIIEHMKILTGSLGTFPKKNPSLNNFHSILLKHQVNMIEAWNASKSNSSFGMSSINFLETLQSLKYLQNGSAPAITKNTRQMLKSYQNTSNPQSDSISSNKELLIELANRVATKNKVPKPLFQKLIQAESSFDPKAKSSKGAMGLGQLMPATARELGLSLKKDESIGSVWHPESNLDASARYLRKLFDKYTQKQGIPENEAWNFAVGAYNAGMGNIGRAMDKLDKVEKWDQVAEILHQITGKYSAETINYVNRLRA